MRNWIVHFLGSYLVTSGTFEPREAALKLFFDDHHLSMDTVSFKECLKLCHHLETLEVIFRNSQKHYKDLSASARIVLGAEAFAAHTPVAVYLATIGLSIPELAIVEFPAPMSGCALHHVAEAFAECSEMDDLMEGWTQLGVDLIENGANLCSIKMSRGPKGTPLLVVLRCFIERMSPFSSIRRPLQRWNDMLRRVDVDFEWYCAKESDMWKILGADIVFWRWLSYTCRARLVEVKFCHETQSCILVLQDDVIIPIVRQSLIPGSFRESRYPVETICWNYLSEDEMEEGHWSRVGDVVIRSSLTYDYDPEPESCGWYNKLIDCTQDDNGTLLRMTRSSRNGNGNRSSKRASSQPSSQYRTRHGDQILFCSRVHTWLPPYHYCHVRSTWTVSCHHGRLQSWMDPRFSNDPRLCVYQKDNDIIGQHWLRDANFLGEIGDCQSFRHRTGDPLHPLLRHSHRIGCPQGCDQVDLEQLAKPPFLPPWHPCRNEL
jgi:hypothetical protein